MMVPGAANSLAARVIEDLGFEAVYLTGAGISNTYFGVPDLGFIGLTDLVQHTMALRQAVSLPLIVDIDTGFGNAVNVYHTVQRLELAGANGIQVEDQAMPKKCGHFEGKEIVGRQEAVDRVRAAVDARNDEDFQIIARTDARAVSGLEEALERAALFVEAGADVAFIEAPENIDEIERIMGHLDVPQVLNIVHGGKTPPITRERAQELGCGMLLYANLALQSAMFGMQEALKDLRDSGTVAQAAAGIVSFEDRQRYVRKEFFDKMGETYTAR